MKTSFDRYRRTLFPAGRMAAGTMLALSLTITAAAGVVAQEAGETPVPTSTPEGTATPLPPLPSMSQLLYYTPTPPETETPQPTETPVPSETPTPEPTHTPQPPAAPYEPERAPERAEVAGAATAQDTHTEADKGPISSEPPAAPPAAPVTDSEPALKATLTPLNVSAGQTPEPPLSLTPAGIAQGGPGTEGASLPQGMFVTVGALLLAAGGSWGAYYFLRPPMD